MDFQEAVGGGMIPLMMILIEDDPLKEDQEDFPEQCLTVLLVEVTLILLEDPEILVGLVVLVVLAVPVAQAAQTV